MSRFSLLFSCFGGVPTRSQLARIANLLRFYTEPQTAPRCINHSGSAFGAKERNRTSTLPITNRMHRQLCYFGIFAGFPPAPTLYTRGPVDHRTGSNRVSVPSNEPVTYTPIFTALFVPPQCSGLSPGPLTAQQPWGVILERRRTLLELPEGLEPTTCRLQVGCSTN